MPKSLIFCAKLALIILLFSYLVWRALQGAALQELNVKTFYWSFLLIGLFFNLLSTTLTIIRWKYLVEALRASLTMSDALRFGFIGFLFNLSPVGIVGGDAIKVVLLVKKSGIGADRATASVVIDRLIGLYVMFLLGVFAVFATGFYQREEPLAKFATLGSIALFLASTILLALLLWPSSRQNRRVTLMAKLPLVGTVLAKLANAMLEYRKSKKVLLLSFIITVFVHLGFSVSLYFLARGLFHAAPSLSNHVVLYCLANVGSIIPLSAGPLELFLDELYPLFPIVARASFQVGHGMAIGMAYRLTTVLVAMVGMGYYLTSRKSLPTQQEDSANKAHA